VSKPIAYLSNIGGNPMENLWAIILACGIPSTITGLIVGWFVKKQNDRDRAREELNILIVQGVNASIGLGEAVAIAQKNGKCNGETEKATKYAIDVKHKIRDFLTKRSVESVY
jgi:hypothetical protein